MPQATQLADRRFEEVPEITPGAALLRANGTTDPIPASLPPAAGPDSHGAEPHSEPAPPGHPTSGWARWWRLILIIAGLAVALAGVAAAGLITAPPHPGSVQIGHERLNWVIPAAGLAALAAALLLWRAARRLTRGRRASDVLTVVAAGMATAVSATGMWHFFQVILHFDVTLRVLLFAFDEVAVVGFAVHARENIHKKLPPGADGVAVWVLTGASGLLASMAAASIPEALFRLAVPLIAAYQWERWLTREQRQEKGRQIHWRITPQRALLRLGLAESASRTPSEVTAHRYITSLARAAIKVRVLDDAAAGWPLRRARRRLVQAMDQAIIHTDLATNPQRHAELRLVIGALVNAQELADLTPDAPWETDSPAGPAASQTPRSGPQADDNRRARPNGGPPVAHSGPRAAGPAGSRESPGPKTPAVVHADGEQGRLIGELLPCLRQREQGIWRLDQLLADRTDYAELASSLGRDGQRGTKTLLAAVALYAGGDLSSRAAAGRWIADQVPDPARRPDKAEIRRMAHRLEPAWTGHRAGKAEVES
jgi:hypothetical protein